MEHQDERMFGSIRFLSYPEATTSVGSFFGAVGIAFLLTAFTVPAVQAQYASDDASESVYDDGWDNGDNGGSGFDAWILNSDGSNSGHFVSSSTDNGNANNDDDIDTGADKSLALFAHSEELSEAIRPLSSRLQVGERFELSFDNGNIQSGDPGGSVGFGLQNGDGENLVEVFFEGGDSNYTLNDASGVTDTGIGFTRDGLAIEITLTSPSEYRISINALNGGDFATTGSLIDPSGGQSVEQLRVFNFNAGPNASDNFFVNSFAARSLVFNATQATEPPDIQTAVDNANADDAIAIGRGSYGEELSIPKSLALRGTFTTTSLTVSDGTTTIESASGGDNVNMTLTGDLEVQDGSEFAIMGGTATDVNGNVTANGTVTLGGSLGGDLKVAGDLNLDGTFNSNSRAVFFDGTDSQAQELDATSGTFGFLVFDNTGGGVKLVNNDVEVDGASGAPLQFRNSGGLDLNGRTMTLSGSGGNIRIDGGTRTITSSSSSGVLKVDGDKAVTGGGELELNSSGSDVTMRITSGALDESDGRVTTANGGTIEATRTLDDVTDENVAGLGAVITTSASLGNVTVTRGHAIQSANGAESIERYYDIAPSQNNSGLNADLTFNYADTESNGISESELILFKSNDGGDNWDLVGADSRDDGANEVTFNGVESFSRWTLGSEGNPLPVELASFNARKNGRGAVLNWTTASEADNGGFEVQHAVGSGSFETAGWIDGAGTTTESRSYNFSVSDLSAGTHRFRLKQVDLDGSAGFSGVETVEIGPEGAVAIQGVAPNPLQGQGTLRFTTRESETVTVGLYDVLGRRVETLHQGRVQANQSAQVRIDAVSLSSGTYFLRVEGESFTRTTRVTVAR